jgi:hypothetical protein
MTTPADPDKQPSREGDPLQPFTQELHVTNLGARVPEAVARGVFATGAFVLQGPTEFAIDFVLRMNQPHQIVARVILPINLVPHVIDTLKANLDIYRQAHGSTPAHATASPASPANPANPANPAPAATATAKPATTVNVDEVYHDLKMAEDVMRGAYANTLLVVHNATEFCLDFISRLYPRAVVTARVFLSAPQVPILLASITQSWQTFQAKRQQQQPPPRPTS